jgi:hypothetical protein
MNAKSAVATHPDGINSFPKIYPPPGANPNQQIVLWDEFVRITAGKGRLRIKLTKKSA